MSELYYFGQGWITDRPRRAQPAPRGDHLAGEDDVLPRSLKLATELAGKHRPTLAEHKRLMYGEAIRALLG